MSNVSKNMDASALCGERAEWQAGAPVGWANNWHILTCQRNGATGTIYGDSALLKTETDSSESQSDSGTVGIGVGMTGNIAELIIANAAWTTGQRQAAESAANNYWGVY